MSDTIVTGPGTIAGHLPPMTDAQQLVEQYRALTVPGSMANTWKWAKRVTAALTPLGRSTIGYASGQPATVAMFRCADGTRFAYDLNGAKSVWAMPAED
jgi:hypothetical protein